MARIRTIKPEFFRHAGLFDAETETGLPLRLAFAGLWTAADREGRFKWRPSELKLDALPFDNVDFSRVLDALTTRGFIVRYTSEGKDYGYIPSWRDHQHINHRESDSVLPDPNGQMSEIVDEADASLTRHPRVEHASATRHGRARGEGKGREGKGRERKDYCPKPAAPLPDQNLFDGGLDTPPAKNPPAKRGRNQYPEDFETFWREYPTDPGMSKIEAAKAWEKLPPDRRLAARQAIPKFRDWVQNQGPNYRVVHAVRYLTQGRFDGFTAPPQPQTGPPADRRIMTPLGTELARRLQYHGAAAFNPESNWLEWTDKGISDGCRLNYPPAPDGYQPEVDL